MLIKKNKFISTMFSIYTSNQWHLSLAKAAQLDMYSSFFYNNKKKRGFHQNFI